MAGPHKLNIVYHCILYKQFAATNFFSETKIFIFELLMTKKRNNLPTIKETDKNSLRGFVQIWIRNPIRKNHYPPGSRIRKAEIATRLNVRRVSAREVFSRLQADDLLGFIPWRGPQVAKRNQVAKFFCHAKSFGGHCCEVCCRTGTSQTIIR